jgi:AAHS family 4-hydroxybenzoate transporter-like MFS transporter
MVSDANVGSVTTVDVGRLLDDGKWGAYQKMLIALTALAIVFDGIDNQLLGVAIPAIMAEWNVPRAAFAPVISIGYAGMMIGGAAAGLAGDRFGRRSVLLISMALFGLTTGLSALATTPMQIAWLRLLASAGLGGAIPNAAVLAAEFVPKRIRPVAVTLTIVCVPVGGMIAGLLGVRLLPVLGWRNLFIIGGVLPLIWALVLWRALPESPRYLVRRPKRWGELASTLSRMGLDAPPDASFVDATEARVAAGSIGALFEKAFRRDTAGVMIAFFACMLAVYLGFSWLTSLLTSGGFDPATANIGIVYFNLGGVVGALVGSMVIGRFGSRMPMLLMAAGAAGSALVLSTMTIDAGRVVPIMAMLTLNGGLINAVQVTLYALAAHVYPSGIRATGVGTASVVGRVGAIISGYAGAWAIDYGGSASYFTMIAAAMIAALIAVSFVSRHVERPQ